MSFPWQQIFYKVLAGVLLLLALFTVFAQVELKPAALIQTTTVKESPESAETISRFEQKPEGVQSQPPEIVVQTKRFLEKNKKANNLVALRYKNSIIFCFKKTSDQNQPCAIVFEKNEPLSGIVVPNLKPKNNQETKLEARLTKAKNFYEQQQRK